MVEALKTLAQNEQFQKILAVLIAWLTANAGTIILFAIKYIKLKAKEIKDKNDNDLMMQLLESKYNKALEASYDKFCNKMDQLEEKVVGKIKSQEEETQQKIDHETETLEKAIAETKKTLSIDDILK